MTTSKRLGGELRNLQIKLPIQYTSQSRVISILTATCIPVECASCMRYVVFLLTRILAH